MAQALPLIAYPDHETRVNAIEEEGYVYFPNVLNAEEIAEMKATMDRLTAVPESFDRYGMPDDNGFINWHINNAFNREICFLRCIDKPGIIELVEEIHGDDCHVIGSTAWTTGPGRPDQGLHTDWLPISLPEDIRMDPRVKIPIFITTAHFYLNDMYQKLGPTNFVPGSHFSGRPPNGDTEWKGKGEQSILCNAGDVIIFRSEVWHRGTANTSDENRYLLQVHYAKRMITQKFPPYLNKFQFDEAILAQATPRQRRLLGDHRPSNYD